MKIAAAQMTCAPADVRTNAARAAALAVTAREQGAALVVFPEFTLTGYELDALAADPGLWTGADDPRLDPLRAAGIATAVNVALPGDGPRPAIATLVHDADGAHVTTYRKQHLFRHEQDLFEPGTGDGCFELLGVRFSLGVCYDNTSPNCPAGARPPAAGSTWPAPCTGPATGSASGPPCTRASPNGTACTSSSPTTSARRAREPAAAARPCGPRAARCSPRPTTAPRRW
ncbi:nitrilase-related carbon-nitrogen hydrolase [Streptomyces yangpuensis]|uniref:carbon-nitrogen hydrolase family protein n=1 Tax=Streptomyces yangpuensis TaxID=1648182 RepID=UPI003664A02E